MDFIFRGLTGECAPFQPEMLRCPFLRNINEPTNFSFSSTMAFPMPVHSEKGPIFEDGPNFETAFRLFHGRDGVVPLSERAFLHSEKVFPESAAPEINPLAAKAATISLSSFWPGGPFGFHSFSEKWNNQKRKSNSSEKESSSKGGRSNHEALSNEWLQSGNCPIAKSYRAVSNFLPLVAKVLQPPEGVQLRCPPAIVAARAALAQTAFAKNLHPQPLPTKVLVIGMLGFAANIPLGIWREHIEKLSPSWFAAVHAAVPFIAMLRKCVLMPKSAMIFTIGASVLGQIIGSRAERYRLKKVAEKNLPLAETCVAEKTLSLVVTSVGGSSQLQVVTSKGGHCVEWEKSFCSMAGPPSSAQQVY